MRNIFSSLRRFTVHHYVAVMLLTGACVDPEDLMLRGTVDVIVVDGTITNLAESQIIRLNHAKADRLTGRFGTTPITKATVNVVVDSTQVFSASETEDGNYQLPSNFKGQVGHSYQLRFTLTDGTRYVSSQQVMQPVPPIDNVSARFNPKSLSRKVLDIYPAAHDIFIDFKDPVEQHNYYRWDWKLWEKQLWCKTCIQGEYAQYNIIGKRYSDDCYISGDQLYEDCYSPPGITMPQYNYGGHNLYFVYDYNCRTNCWEIIYNYTINVFDDKYSNGNFVQGRRIAQIPYYQPEGCLIEIRQLSMTADAYRYFQLLQQQTQNTGGITDTPPTAPIGNISNVMNSREKVVGYFSASAASTVRYWLDRKGATGEFPGLFQGLNGRLPIPEPDVPFFCIADPPTRPPTAICAPSDSKTPFKPEGWRD